MTVVVTREVPGRFRGFLASCMCEIAPGVYTAPRMSAGVRERVWSVLEDWWMAYPDCSVLMTWPDRRLAGGQNLRTLGLPRQDLHNHCGVFLARRGGAVDPARSATEAAESAATETPETGATAEEQAAPELPPEATSSGTDPKPESLSNHQEHGEKPTLPFQGDRRGPGP